MRVKRARVWPALCNSALLHQIVILEKLTLRCRTSFSRYRALCEFSFFYTCINFSLRSIHLSRASYMYARPTFYIQCMYAHISESRPINRRVAVRAAPLCHFEFEQQSFTVESSNRNFAPTAEACTLGTRKLPTSGGAITNACGAFTNIGDYKNIRATN